MFIEFGNEFKDDLEPDYSYFESRNGYGEYGLLSLVKPGTGQRPDSEFKVYNPLSHKIDTKLPDNCLLNQMKNRNRENNSMRVGQFYSY